MWNMQYDLCCASSDCSRHLPVYRLGKKERYILFWVQQVLKWFEFRGMKYLHFNHVRTSTSTLCIQSLLMWESSCPKPRILRGFIPQPSQIGWVHGTTGAISLSSLSLYQTYSMTLWQSSSAYLPERGIGVEAITSVCWLERGWQRPWR